MKEDLKKENYEYQLDKHIENIEFGTGMGGTIGSLQRAEQGMRDFVRELLAKERQKTLEEVRDMIVKEGLIVDGNKKYESFEDGFNEGIEKSIEVINNNLKLLKEENEKE